MLIIHLYFNLSKLLYSFLGRRDRRFIVCESLGSVVVCLGVVALGDSIVHLTRVHFSSNGIVSDTLFPILCGLTFTATSILSRLIAKSNPEELAKLKSEKKLIVIHGNRESVLEIGSGNRIVSVGIIDFSWLAIMGSAYACVLYCSRLDAIVNSIPAGRAPEFYRLYFDELSYLFGKSIDMILLLGSILAICMSILWSGELWRKQDEESRAQYSTSTIASIKMVTAFLIIAVSVAIWFTIPTYERLSGVKALLQ